MKKKKVFMIRSNPVNPDSRVEKEASSLIKDGYNIVVLAWDRDSNHKISYEFIRFDKCNIPVVRFGHKANYGDGMKKLIPYICFQFNLIKFLITERDKYCAIHACDFDTALFSIILSKVLRKRFVFDIFDFICGDPKNFLQNIIKIMQFKIINHSDATIICSEERRRQIKGANPRKLVVIHNTPKMEFSKSKVLKSCNDKIKIGYVGILSDHRLLKEIGEFFSENKNIELHIGGFGQYDSYFDMLSKNYDNIFYYGRLDYDQTLSLENDCDILTAIYDPVIENHKFAAPNKFYEALELGKPLIMVKNTGMSEIVKENGIGVLIDYSFSGFENGINEMVGIRGKWSQIKVIMNDLYHNEYSWIMMEERLKSLYQDII